MRTWLSESELKQIIGQENADSIIEGYGGQRLYVPSQAHENHKIALLIGFDNMSSLCATYPSQYIELPSKNKMQTAKQRILVLFEKGELSKADIAAQVGVGVRYVEQVTKGKASKHKGLSSASQ